MNQTQGVRHPKSCLPFSLSATRLIDHGMGAREGGNSRRSERARHQRQLRAIEGSVCGMGPSRTPSVRLAAHKTPEFVVIGADN